MRSRLVPQCVENLQCYLHCQALGVTVQTQPGDLLDPFDAVRDRVRMYVQDPGGALRAVVLAEVPRERHQVLGFALTLVPAELAEHVGRERSAELTRITAGPADPDDHLCSREQLGEPRDTGGAEAARIHAARALTLR